MGVSCIGILKNLFPKVQFICATHSPFIVQALSEHELISLDHEIETEYSKSGIEDIAEKIMGVELPVYSQERLELYQLANEYYRQVMEAESDEQIERLGSRLKELSEK